MMLYFAVSKTTMDKIYFLASCDTCRKIIKTLPPNNLVFQDIRQDPITEQQLEEMRQLSGSYEALFSKKAQLYKSLNLKEKILSEEDYKKHLLQHYTFLSRPVFIISDKIYIGSGQNTIRDVIAALTDR